MFWKILIFPFLFYVSLSHGILVDSVKRTDTIEKNRQKLNNKDDHFNRFNNFKTLNNSKVVTQVGSSAVLPCSLFNPSSDVIAWIRKTDYKLLTGKYGSM